MNHHEYLAVKGGALKFSLQYEAKPAWDREFGIPLKDHLLSLDEESMEVGGGRLYIRRPKGKRVFCAEKIGADILLLARAGGLKMPDVVQLLEAGMLIVNPTKEVALLAARRTSKQLRGYTRWQKAGAPEMRWPAKGVLAQWHKALRKVADLTVHIAKAAATKPLKTIEKLLKK